MRTFLLTALSRFSHEQHRKGTAQKRGGGEAPIEIDALAAEQRYSMEPRDELSPEREFDRAWARQLLASVLTRLGQAYGDAGKWEVFAALQDHNPTAKSCSVALLKPSTGLRA